jgi:hypothetical protein
VLPPLPAQLQRCVRWDQLAQLVAQQQQQQQQQHESGGCQGPIQLAAAPSPEAVAARLLLDWSAMPAVVDPAIGGQLADRDVVAAGHSSGRMNLRALRKRAQVTPLWAVVGCRRGRVVCQDGGA